MSPLDVILWTLAVLIAFSALVVIVSFVSTAVRSFRAEVRRSRHNRRNG